MNQQSQSAGPNLDLSIQVNKDSQIAILMKELKSLQTRLSLLKDCQVKQRQLNDQIDKLQEQSQEHYSTIRKLTLEYSDQSNIFTSKTQNRSEDIEDERDRIESNIEYLRQQNQRLDEMCKRKLEEKAKLLQSIQIYHNKKEKFSIVLHQERKKVAEQLKINKFIQETEQSARRENQIYQEEIFQADVKGQNLRKYGYEVLPQKLSLLLKAKEMIEADLHDIQQKQQRHKKNVSKLVRGVLLQKAKEALNEEKQRQAKLNQLRQQNLQLRVENERLDNIKKQLQNPNSQIQELQLNIASQERKIGNIESVLSVLKRKSIEINQKIKQYNHYLHTQTESNTADEQENDTKKIKDKFNRKEKYKNRNNPTIFQEIKTDLQLRDPSKKFDWKSLLPFPKQKKDEPNIIKINEYQYRVIKPPQLTSIIMVTLVLVGLSCFCMKYLKK